MLRRVLSSLREYSFFSGLVVLAYFLFGSALLIGLAVNFAATKELGLARDSAELQVSLQVNIKNAYAKRLHAYAKRLQDGDEVSDDEVHQVPVLTLEDAQRLSGFQEVAGVRYLATAKVVGVDISPVGQNNGTTIDEAYFIPEFLLEGVSESAMVADFAEGRHQLINGEAITEDIAAEANVAVIEIGLARENGLELGDSFVVRGVSGIELRYLIIGMYRSYEKKSEGVAGRVALLFPENKIYVPVRSVSHLDDANHEDHVIDRAIYNLHSPTDFESFRLKAISRGIDINQYTFYLDDGEYLAMQAPIRSVVSGSSWVIIFSGVLLFLFTVLVGLIVKRYRYHRFSQLLKLGMSNQRTFVQALLEFAILITFGLILAIILSPFTFQIFDHVVSSFLFDQVRNTHILPFREGLSVIAIVDSDYRGWLHVVSELQFMNNLSLWFSAFSVGFMIAMNAAMYPLWGIFHMEVDYDE